MRTPSEGYQSIKKIAFYLHNSKKSSTFARYLWSINEITKYYNEKKYSFFSSRCKLFDSCCARLGRDLDDN